MKKKTICLVLAMAMSMASLAGCGNEANSAPAADGGVMADSEVVADNGGVFESPAAEEATNNVNDSAPAADSHNMAAAAAASEDCEYEVAFSADDMYAIEDEEWDDYYEYPEEKFDNEQYTQQMENSFCDVKTSPLSTFGADVDTASYSNFRRFVSYGYGLEDFDTGSIRTEEMLNYFTYDYDAPDDEVFGVEATISNCPWNEDSKLMVVGVNTADIKRREMPDSNIVFLVDVSGSMYDDNKLPLIQECMGNVIEQFGKNDRISIVTYASGTNVVLDGEAGNEHKKIMKAFNGLEAGGSTNGSGGIQLAYKTAEENFIEDGINRVIIMTDGDFNVGLTSQSELYDLITEKKESGIFLSTLGFGMYNYNDTTMETLADNGNGNYAYIDTYAEAQKVLVEEMTKNFTCVAKDVKLQVEFNPSLVESYRLIGYENRSLAAEDFKDDTKDGGELGAGHQVTAVYEIVLADDDVDLENDLKYQDSTLSKKGKKGDEYCTVNIAYKEPDEDKSQYLEFPIDIDNYEKRPGLNYIWAASVAEMSLALKDSEYLGDLTREDAVEDVYKRIKRLDDLDEYQEEFVDLVEDIYSSL